MGPRWHSRSVRCCRYTWEPVAADAAGADKDLRFVFDFIYTCHYGYNRSTTLVLFGLILFYFPLALLRRPLPLSLSGCIAFPPLPSWPRSPNILTLLRIPLSGHVFKTPRALVGGMDYLWSSHRISPTLLLVFSSFPCEVSPFLSI